MNEALVLIDIQNDYFPGGAAALHEPVAASEQATPLLAAFRAQGKPIVHVQHISTRAGATFFLPNTEGAEIHQSVAPRDGETIIVKHFPNSFRETALLQRLRDQQIDSLVIAGMMTHMCVDTTVRAASDLGFRCALAADACATKALTFGDNTVAAKDVQLAYLAALSGSFANVQNTSTILASIAQHNA